jgi:uncharacterized protein
LSAAALTLLSKANVARLIVFLIRIYQWILSPLLGPCCRFTPSCSQYACGCVERFGVGRGLALSVWRILRCQPFSAGGHDPVPALAGELAAASESKA